MNRAQSVWWLNPVLLFVSMAVMATAAAIWVPDHMYHLLWRSPKYFTVQAALLVLACAACFAAGAIVPGLRPSGWWPRGGSTGVPASLDTRLLFRLYYIGVVLCLIGYAVWGSMAVRRGLNLHILLSFVAGKHGLSEQLRSQYLGNITGVTTCTQFGLACGILGMLLIQQGQWKQIRFSFLPIFGLAILRAMLNSERLAVIELVVPVIALAIQFSVVPRAQGVVRRRILELAPLGGSVVLYFLFAFFEYFRSWVTYYAGHSEYSFWTFAGCRLAGYYVTALNNGAFLLERLDWPVNAPFFSLNFLWNFPLLKDLMDNIFGTPVGAKAYFDILERSVNAEFNNSDGYLIPFMDFGLPGGLLHWFVIGAICGGLYRSFLRRSAWGQLLYPVAFLGLVDVVRGLYWASGRAIPGVAFLIVSAFCLRLRQRRSLPDASGTPVATELLA